MGSIISAIAATLRQSAYNLAMDCRDAVSRHIDFFYLENKGGLFLKAPFLPLSAWIEWGQPHAGFDTERTSETDLEFFLGTIRGVLSVETKVERDAT